MARLQLVPAYGRDYKTKSAVLADWLEEKDFTIAEYGHPYDTKPCNRQQTTDREQVWIRYDRLTKNTRVPNATEATPKPRKPRERGIPSVKVWRVVVRQMAEPNAVFHVLAPTRRLAIMNLRSARGEYVKGNLRVWGPIDSCGTLRKTPNTVFPAGVLAVRVK
jgi:hypothetical protein